MRVCEKNNFGEKNVCKNLAGSNFCINTHTHTHLSTKQQKKSVSIYSSAFSQKRAGDLCVVSTRFVYVPVIVINKNNRYE
jgi:hypothetical protein